MIEVATTVVSWTLALLLLRRRRRQRAAEEREWRIRSARQGLERLREAR